MNPANPKHFYNLDQIKQVPILDVCRHFGVFVEKRGNSYWCKLRPERTASVILHPDKNTYHDFGISKTDNVIGLVSSFFNCTPGEAITYIAEAFHIVPEDRSVQLQTGDLTPWEYNAIGLDGNMASRNFDFDLERLGFKKVEELSFRYVMPMNVLKKTNSEIYARLLLMRSLPHLSSLRNDYYAEVFSLYNLAREMGNTQLFYDRVKNGEFDDIIRNLTTSERVFQRACKGTKIKAWPVGSYDPASDIDKILSGEIFVSLSQCTKRDMEQYAKRFHTSIKYVDVDFGSFMSQYSKLEEFPHSAFLKNGKVVISYLESDREKILPLLLEMKSNRTGNLENKITEAKQRKDGAAYENLAADSRNESAASLREER